MNISENLRSANGASTACWMGALLSGLGLGAALMYLFDPDRGRGRRARLSDQMTSKANTLGDAVESKARDLRNRAQGLLHEARSIFPGNERTARQGNGANRSEAVNEGAGQQLGDELV